MCYRTDLSNIITPTIQNQKEKNQQSYENYLKNSMRQMTSKTKFKWQIGEMGCLSCMKWINILKLVIHKSLNIIQIYWHNFFRRLHGRIVGYVSTVYLFCAVSISLWGWGPLYTTFDKPCWDRALSVRAMDPMLEG